MGGAEVAGGAAEVVEVGVGGVEGGRGFAPGDDDCFDGVEEGLGLGVVEWLLLGVLFLGDLGVAGVEHLTGAVATGSAWAVVVEVDSGHGGSRLNRESGKNTIRKSRRSA